MNSAFSALTPFMPESTTSTFNYFKEGDNSYIKALQEVIDIENIPQEMGGTGPNFGDIPI